MEHVPLTHRALDQMGATSSYSGYNPKKATQCPSFDPRYCIIRCLTLNTMAIVDRSNFDQVYCLVHIVKILEALTMTAVAIFQQSEGSLSVYDSTTMYMATSLPRNSSNAYS